MTDQLPAAAAAVDSAADVVASATSHLARAATVDGRISVARARRAPGARVRPRTHGERGGSGRVMLDVRGARRGRVAPGGAFVADAVAELGAKLLGREAVWGVDASLLADALPFVEAHRTPEFLEQVAATLERTGTGPSHLPDDFQLAAETFHRFAEDKIRPVAEHVHRTNADIPEDVINGLAEIGGFGLSVPEEFGGFAAGGEADYLGMVVATEELSWGSLGVGGSLITRPEILTRAIVTGGTEEQKQRWLPRIAAGELMVGVMVTEPDFGSDVAGVATSATAVDGGYVINGVKTWATFAGRADALMCSPAPIPTAGITHRGLSLFVVEKDPVPGHSFALEQSGGGKIEGRAIDTLGYRGMHSYEVSFSDWFVQAENLVGEEGGLGKGFYLQMEGFENGRLQTAARAVALAPARPVHRQGETQQRIDQSLLGGFQLVPCREVAAFAQVRDGAVERAGDTEAAGRRGGPEPVAHPILVVGAERICRGGAILIRDPVGGLAGRPQGDDRAPDRLESERAVAAKALHILEVDLVAAMGAGEVLHPSASFCRP